MSTEISGDGFYHSYGGVSSLRFGGSAVRFDINPFCACVYTFDTHGNRRCRYNNFPHVLPLHSSLSWIPHAPSIILSCPNKEDHERSWVAATDAFLFLLLLLAGEGSFFLSYSKPYTYDILAEQGVWRKPFFILTESRRVYPIIPVVLLTYIHISHFYSTTFSSFILILDSIVVLVIFRQLNGRM